MIPAIQVIKINNCNISKKEATSIGKVLSDFKSIRELDLSNNNMSQEVAKEIADGLMRAKQLEIARFANNPAMGTGSISILYNLAFNPKIQLIDFHKVSLRSNEHAESLYKLLNISGSIETLILSNTSVGNYLSEDFFKALGDSRTLTYLNMNDDSCMSGPKLEYLGKALAMNKKKNGSLIHLGIKSAINTNTALENFILNMKISDKDQEDWYGDRKVAKEMKGDQLEKNYHFGLKSVDMGNCSITQSAFKMKAKLKENKPKWPHFMHFLTSPILESINLENCNLSKSDAELLTYAVNENPVGECKLKNLNIMRNKNFTKDGFKMFASLVGQNKHM
jgi:hypothetical protein